MDKQFWQDCEGLADGAVIGSAEEVIGKLQFNADGLLPVVVCCADSRQVLMMAWMNKEALQQTLTEKTMVYFSRRRQSLWKKGESSGCYQKLVRLAVDCDGDTLLAYVDQAGAGACHTLRKHCFYIELDATRAVVCSE